MSSDQAGGAVLSLFSAGADAFRPRKMSPSERVIRAMPALWVRRSARVSPSESSQAHIQTSRGVFVAGRDPVQFETADDDLFPDQRPQGHVQREPAAIDERVGPVGQQRLLDRQPEREGEADAADRKVHAERLGGVADRLAPDEILNGRNVEQRGGEQHRQQDDDQCPKRIFYDFSQHVHNERFRLPQNSSR